MKALLVAGWIASGFVGAGLYRASLRGLDVQFHMQSVHDVRQDAGMSLIFGATGPIVLIMGFVCGGLGEDGFESPLSASFYETLDKWPDR